MKSRYRDEDVIIQNSKRLRPPIEGSKNVRSTDFPVLKVLSITEENSNMDDVPNSTHPSIFYAW